MTIYLVMSRNGSEAWGTEIWRKTEAAAEQWISDQRMRTGGMTYCVVEFMGDYVGTPRSEQPLKVARR